MKTRLIVAPLASLGIALSSLAVAAEHPSDAEIAKQQAPLIASVKKAAGEASRKSVDIKATAHQIVVNVPDGKGSKTEREHDASTIAAAVADAIAGKAPFSQVLIIRVQFANADQFDFMKDAQGVFRPHAT